MPLKESQPQLDIELRIEPVSSEILSGLAQFGSEVRQENDLIRLKSDAEGAIPEIARWLVHHGVAIHAIGSRRKSLEQWFIEVMGSDQSPG
jgi:hypothetical protein